MKKKPNKPVKSAKKAPKSLAELKNDYEYATDPMTKRLLRDMIRLQDPKFKG